VTLVHYGERIHDRLELPELSAYLQDVFAHEGVTLHLEDEVVALEGTGAVAAARLDSGRRVGADLVVGSIGVEPAVGLLHDTAVELDDGVVVDEQFRSSVPGILAIGDVARFSDPVLGRRRRIEHWDNASYQGELCGQLLAREAGAAGYDHVSMFFTDLFDLSFEVYGDVDQHDRAVWRGDPGSGEAVVAYVDRDDMLVAALTLGVDDDVRQAITELIARRVVLAEPDVFENDTEAIEDAFAGAGVGRASR
jgi:NADPH-dependent 2,4-dienoyl-CoA reductase/sulfur reductase-like enzyme